MARKPRIAKLASFSAPRDGWIANQALSQPNARKADGSPLLGASVLDNMFPTATGVRLMRGSQLYATLGGGISPVTALFQYNANGIQRMFGATSTTIYDLTTVLSPGNILLGAGNGDDVLGTEDADILGIQSTDGLDVVTAQNGGDWIVAQFATAGGVYLVCVNGTDESLLYDGSHFYPQVAGGIYTLSYDNGTGLFTKNEDIAGGTSTATANVYGVRPTDPLDPEAAGVLLLTGVANGPFQSGETLTGDGSGAAEAASASALVPGTNMTFAGPPDPALDTSSLNYVWAYQQRLFFIEKGTMNAWYLSVDQVGGELTKLPLAGVFPLGGDLLFGASWSLDSGASGGLSEQCIFVTTEGEVAVFQGTNPGSADEWSKVGVYRIGRPLGKKAWIRDGGDLVIATSIGYVRLTQAIQRDNAALGPTAVSYPIEDAWNAAVAQRPEPWSCELWSTQQMAVVALPSPGDTQPAMFIANIRTGAWCQRLNWDATCVLVWKERLFFGTPDGAVVEANITGLDQENTYTGVAVPLFNDFRSPASLKITEAIRPFGLSAYDVIVQPSMQVDYVVNLPPAPPASTIPVGNQWDNAIWDSSVWSSPVDVRPIMEWSVVSGYGYAFSASIQVTSGSVVPLDYELVRMDFLYQTAEVMT
jgi:hypothetical protein